MALAKRIDAAVREGGVISTVGFRERYRPIFQEARRLLRDKRVVHVRFQQIAPQPDACRRRSDSMVVPGGKRRRPLLRLGRARHGLHPVHDRPECAQIPGLPVPSGRIPHSALIVLSLPVVFRRHGDTVLCRVRSYRTGRGALFQDILRGGRLSIFGYERIEIKRRGRIRSRALRSVAGTGPDIRRSGAFKPPRTTTKRLPRRAEVACSDPGWMGIDPKGWGLRRRGSVDQGSVTNPRRITCTGEV